MSAFSHQPLMDLAFISNWNGKFSGIEMNACFSNGVQNFNNLQVFPSSDELKKWGFSSGDCNQFNGGFESHFTGEVGENVETQMKIGAIAECESPTDAESDKVMQETSSDQNSIEKKRRKSNGYSVNSSHSKENIGGKGKRSKSNREERKPRSEQSNDKSSKEGGDDPTKSYIHVRARRGQATDSHSLAERVRREKISERMKLLQGLVPGCDKQVTGKALMLDEIINYVQSLQKQVEFLSMKLASVNPMFYNIDMEMEVCMEKPEKLQSLNAPLPSLQASCHTQPTIDYEAITASFANTTAFPTTTNYSLFNNSGSILLHDQRPTAFSEDNGNRGWSVEHQSQRFDHGGFNQMGSF
ncbi:hypothetical protein AMTRI_Chr06g170690 [Amborella trichopoda]